MRIKFRYKPGKPPEVVDADTDTPIEGVVRADIVILPTGAEATLTIHNVEVEIEVDDPIIVHENPNF